jgi:hypothetical protein
MDISRTLDTFRIGINDCDLIIEGKMPGNRRADLTYATNNDVHLCSFR